MKLDARTAEAVVNLRANENFQIFLDFLRRDRDVCIAEAVYSEEEKGVDKGKAQYADTLIKEIDGAKDILERNRGKTHG